MVLVYRQIISGKVFYVSADADTFIPDYDDNGTVGYAHGEIVAYEGVYPLDQEVETG